MNWEILANSKLVENLGWTLLHSLWQITAVALALVCALRILRAASANARYAAAVAAFVLAVALPVLTFVQLSRNSHMIASQPSNNGSAINEKARRAAAQREAFSADEKLKTEGEAAGQKNARGSIENLQSVFQENFARVLPFAVAFWLVGVAFFGARLAGGVWQLHVYKKRGISAPDSGWLERFEALCEKLKVSQPVRLLRSTRLETPVVVGWFKPVILVPASVFLQLSPRELETIIAHELVHIRRADAFVNLAQNAAETVLFYHPCIWWISRVIRAEREFAADAAVLEIFENSRIVYANALANLEGIRSRANQTLPRYVTAANGGNLMQRIAKILQKNTGIKRSASAWSAGFAFALIPAVLLAVFSFNQTSLVNAQKKSSTKKLALGFVSIPPLDRTDNAPRDADATLRLLVKTLKQYKVPAIGFLQGGMISDGAKLYPVRADMVRLWRDAGFEIGIGGYKHIWFYDTPYDEYVANVEKNEQIARKLLAEKNLPLKYFSYPFLNTGKTAQDRARFEKWLQEKNLAPVKYTVDNSEWMYSYAYDMARNDNDVNTMAEIRAAFVKYMSEMFDHYEAYSQEMFGRDIAQTMVLTPSRLIADSGDELFGMLEKRGYRFVSMDEALADEAYKTEENFVNTKDRIGKSGISWFERWSMSQGRSLRDEPRVDALVQKIWDEKKPQK
jgi:beta-lactamase regulating signal transducer with metallopeptidase domain/peptidoglycan/xylan/chitin deacetylase (PgdA/CDA1 family)